MSPLIGLLLGLVLVGTTWSLEARAEVDVELVLAIDSSASVDGFEFAQQIEGLAAAFRDPEVVDAIVNGRSGRISVAVYEWASANVQSIAVPWMLVDGPAAAEGLARRVEAMQRTVVGATSISGAIEFASALLAANPYPGARQVIDISGDGRSNQGRDVRLARDDAILTGITINGLVILNEVETLHYYFEQRVIGGFASFVEVAQDYSDYARAIQSKLLREIRDRPVSERPSGATMLARVP